MASRIPLNTMIPFVTTFLRKSFALEQNFTKDKDQFFLLRYLTFFYAIRNESSRGVLQRVFWYCQLSVPIIVLCSYCHKAYWQLTHNVYSFATFNIVGTMWILVSGLTRGIIFDRTVLEFIEQFLNNSSFREDEEEVATVRSNVRLQNNRFLIVVSFTLLLETCIFSQTNLLHQSEFMILYKGQVVGGYFIQFLYGFGTCVIGSLYVMVFAFIYVLLNVFRAEMSILVQSFKRINECFDKYKPCLDTTSSYAQEAAFWEELQALIKFNVQRHVELLEHLAVFRKVLKPFSLVQYYGSFTLIAFYSFILMYKGVTTLTIAYIGFVAVLVVEPYLFCKIMSEINNLHSQISAVLFELEWYKKLRFSPRFASAYRQMRVSFLIIIIRSQTPLSFTFNGVGTISMSRFTELLNSSYSCIALLFQLKNEVFQFN